MSDLNTQLATAREFGEITEQGDAYIVPVTSTEQIETGKTFQVWDAANGMFRAVTVIVHNRNQGVFLVKVDGATDRVIFEEELVDALCHPLTGTIVPMPPMSGVAA